MATLTLNLPTHGVAPKTVGVTPRPGFWRRLFDAMIEARMRRAEIELAEHRRFLARDFGFDSRSEDKGRDLGALPFVR